MVHLKTLQRLKHLNARHLPITDTGLFYVSHCLQLRKLDVRECSEVTKKGVMYLRKLEHLVELKHSIKDNSFKCQNLRVDDDRYCNIF